MAASEGSGKKEFAMDKVEQRVTGTAFAQAFREAEGRSDGPRARDPARDVSGKSAKPLYFRATRAVRWLRAMALALAFGCVSSAIAQTAAPAPSPPAPPIPIEQMRAFGYTKEFAKRFALPEPEPGWEPGEGLLAVEFRVERIPGPRAIYGCDFKLYLDSKLDIAFPEPGLSGSSELYTSRTHSFIERGKGMPDIQEADRRARFERQNAFAQIAAFATTDYVTGRRGGLISSSITEFVRELFPGVSYVRAHDCTLALSLSRRETNFAVWVKKSSGKDYTRTTVRDPNDFYQLPLPSALIAKVRPWSEWVRQLNHSIFEAEAREPREQPDSRGAR